MLVCDEDRRLSSLSGKFHGGQDRWLGSSDRAPLVNPLCSMEEAVCLTDSASKPSSFVYVTNISNLLPSILIAGKTHPIIRHAFIDLLATSTTREPVQTDLPC